LSQADLVYEYIVDGFSLTRITAMFQANDADRVGPVRSARFPNIWMVQMYGGALACSGGSDHIRYLLKNEVGFPYLDADIDDPSNTVYFQNLGSDYRTRLQIGTEAVRRWLADQGITLNWDKPGFSFSDTPPAGEASHCSVSRSASSICSALFWIADRLRLTSLARMRDKVRARPAVSVSIVCSSESTWASVAAATTSEKITPPRRIAVSRRRPDGRAPAAGLSATDDPAGVARDAPDGPS
jgi:hypothetical protein